MFESSLFFRCAHESLGTHGTCGRRMPAKMRSGISLRREKGALASLGCAGRPRPVAAAYFKGGGVDQREPPLALQRGPPATACAHLFARPPDETMGLMEWLPLPEAAPATTLPEEGPATYSSQSPRLRYGWGAEWC
ncbi:hypothetical protein MRX96_043796 [Rhipicephalus microplus]